MVYGSLLSFFCDPGGARTLDPLIKSQLLYQLSYGVVAVLAKSGAKLSHYFHSAKFSGQFFIENGAKRLKEAHLWLVLLVHYKIIVIDFHKNIKNPVRVCYRTQ